MKSPCYFVFNHCIVLCPNLYSINLHNSLRTRSILVLVLSTAEPSRTPHSSKVKVTLRLTFSQSVSLGVEPQTTCLLLFDSYGLTRRRVCHLYMLLVLARAVSLGSESLLTPNQILLSQIWDFLFVASYDSQGYGGGIRSRLHTAIFTHPIYKRFSLYTFRTDHTENAVLSLLSTDHIENKSCDIYLASPLARWLLPSNKLKVFVLFLRAHTAGCLWSRCLIMRWHVTIFT
jgi:hypothetical protein